jgi:predicted methyltransferase
MLHEVPDSAGFLRQAHDSLKPGGSFLLVEPRGHVTKADFAATVAVAENAGFTVVARSRVGFSRAVLFCRT